MKKAIKYTILLMVFGLFAGCGESYLNVNTDPNNPTSVTPDLILPVAQRYTAQMEQTDRRFNSLGNLLMYNWSQSDGFSWYTDEMKYNVTTSFYQDPFNISYLSPLKQYQLLIDLGEGYDYFKAIGMIMKSFHFQWLVDTYGDVPYSEALGRSLEATPVYDDAQTIYEDLITQLTAAIALIKDADEDAQTAVPESDDAMFGGDMDEWIKFANTVKLRILNRQSDMSGRSAYITTELSVINTEGSGYITGDVGVNPGYIAAAVDQMNVIWESIGYATTGTQLNNYKATCATDYIINYLKATNDPRIDKIYEKPSTGHLGVPQNLADYDTPVLDAFIPENVSNIGTGILKSATMDAIIMTLAESYFNQAELATKGFITVSDGGQALYESGITASFAYLGVTSSALSYYGQGIKNVGWTSSTNKVEAIITQKWIAENGITAEQSWFDYNRTGFPSGLPLPNNYVAHDDRPVRLMWPASEYSGNGANIPTQPDAFSENIFWAE